MPFLTSTNPVVTVSGVSPIVSTGGITPIISIQDGTVEQRGAVQLEDSLTSTSITKAATPKNVKETYDYITTVSGNLQVDIGGKSNIGHSHDDRYYRMNFETFTLDATDISNKYIDLSVAPKSNDSLNLFIYKGTEGTPDIDYIVSGVRVSWVGKSWSEILETGDEIRVTCWY